MNISNLFLLIRARRMIQRVRKVDRDLFIGRGAIRTAETDSSLLPQYPQTPTSASAWFVRQGICKTHWAQANGFDRMTIVDLLLGRRKGLRGEGHRAAIALGLKADPYKLVPEAS
ncbi:DNA-binding protein [Pseudomonas carnis]|uniref:DNA-binding protein n=1 Tax=Pseudomonas carnis TaxID=2487355 RepID=UPI00280C18AC|nr:DNA-binding protein [Pseudomonas carnis]